MVTVGPVGVAAAADGVTDCTVIASSGTYVLENDVSADQPNKGCIEIRANNVTFDGQGHAITAGENLEFLGEDDGIYVSGVENVTITNVTTTGWDQLGTGIEIRNAADVTVSNATATDNQFGVTTDNVSVFTFENVTAGGNTHVGIQVNDSSGGMLKDVAAIENVVSEQGWAGISVRGGSMTILLDNATAEGSMNGAAGIEATADTSYIFIPEATVIDNDGVGLKIETNVVVDTGVAVGTVIAHGNEWGVAINKTQPINIPNLILGESTEPGTQLSATASSVRIRGVDSPPDHPDAAPLGRYFEFEEIESSSLRVGLQYEESNVGRIEQPLYLSQYDGSDWTKVPDSMLDEANTVLSGTVSGSGTVGIFGTAPVTSFEVEPVNETIVQGEPLEVTLTNVTTVGGEPFTGTEQFDIFGPNGSFTRVSATIEDGEKRFSPFILMDGEETENLETGEYEELDTVLHATWSDEEQLNATYNVTVVSSPLASFEVEPVDDTIAQGEPLEVMIENATHVRGGSFDGELWTMHEHPDGTFYPTEIDIKNGSSQPETILSRQITGDFDPGEYSLEIRDFNDPSINATYDVELRENGIRSFEVEPVDETIVQGEPLEVTVTNVTSIWGEPFTGTEQFDIFGPNESFAGVSVLIEDGEITSSFTLMDGEETENLQTGEYEELDTVLHATWSDEEQLNATYDVTVVASPVASFEVEPVSETIVQGEPLEVTLTNVTHVRGGAFTGSGTIPIEAPDGSSLSGPDAVISIENGNSQSITVLSGEGTDALEPGTYTGLRGILYENPRVRDTYDVEVVASPVASFDVEPVNETIVQGEPLKVTVTNVTTVRGEPFSGTEQFDIFGPNGSFAGVSAIIEDGEKRFSPFRLMDGEETASLEPGDYEGLDTVLHATWSEEEQLNATYNVTVKAPTFETESEFAGIVQDDSGLEITASWLPVWSGEATLTVADQEIPVPISIEDRNVSTTVDLSEHLDPETETGRALVTLEVEDEFLVANHVRLVHEAYALDEGYTRWSIPQPADVYVTDGVVDMTQWSNAETTYDDVGFEVNTGETITDGEDLHKGLYVNAGTADDRIGFDYVTPGQDALPAGGAQPIEEGWNLLGSNYDVSAGNRTLNLDLDTVASLPATAADYEGDEGVVARRAGSLVRLGGDEVVEPYDTYWVYVDVGEGSATRAIVTAEYDPAARADGDRADDE